MVNCRGCGKKINETTLRCPFCGKPQLIQRATTETPDINNRPNTMTTEPVTSQPPALWNPNAAACWSLLFTPAFGAFLHARNAEALRRFDEARDNRMWFYVSIVYIGLVLLNTYISVIPEGLFKSVALGLLIGWYFSLGKKQIMYVKGTWRDGYEHKPWTKPLLIAIGCLIGAYIVIFIFTFVEKLFFG